jgi:hypothetical protein
MKSISLVIGVLTVFASAAPTSFTRARQFDEVTVQLSNDLSGANAEVSIYADGTDEAIQNLFGSTVIAKGGKVLATSAQLVKFSNEVFCIIKKDERPIGVFNFRTTFAELDHKNGTAIPINLQGAVLNCQV